MKTQTVDEFIRDMLHAANTFGRDLEHPIAACKDRVMEGFYDNFQNERTPGAGRWPKRKRPKPDHPLLQKTGALMRAVIGAGAGHVERITSLDGIAQLEIGVDKGVNQGGLPGAAVHNFGYPKKNIPQREYLALNNEAVKDCAGIMADVMVRVFD